MRRPQLILRLRLVGKYIFFRSLQIQLQTNCSDFRTNHIVERQENGYQKSFPAHGFRYFTEWVQSVIFDCMLLFALAIAPGFAICLLIYFRYRHYKEPAGWLALSFLLGMISTLPAMLIQYLLGDTRENTSTHYILSYALFAYVVVAFSEELSKFLTLRFYAYPRKTFGEPFNAIIYSVMIGMGFATVENIEYVYRFGFQTGFTRFFLSVPAHASFAVLMGYFMGLAKHAPSRRTWLMIKGLLIAVFFHGTYDFCLFLQQNERVTETVSTGLLSFGSFASYYIAVRLAMRSIRLHEAGNATKNE